MANRAKKVALTAVVVIGIAHAAAPQQPPTFDVASVKRAPPTEDGRISVNLAGGPGTHSPGQLTYTNVTLADVIKVAYGMMGPTYDPAHRDDRISGPGWLTTERYNILAKISAAATKSDFQLMLQNLLAERFKLTMHRETKDSSGYALVIARNGPKLKQSTGEADPQPAGVPTNFAVDQDGFRIFPPGRAGITSYVVAGLTRLTASKVSMEEWAFTLKDLTGLPVTDQTGLHGKYDFHLEFARDLTIPGRGGRVMQPPADNSDAEAGPALADAIQAQLGLMLEPRKMAGSTLVIDHAEKEPVEN